MRILVVDDHQVVRTGVRALLEADPEFEVCGEAVDGRDAVAKADETFPDLVVMDISMPNLGGIEATRELVWLHPGIRVVMLSQHDLPHIMRQALSAGACAYVVKSNIGTELVNAIKTHTGSGSMPIYGSTNADTNVQEILRRSGELETALRESEERFRLAQQVSRIGTFELNPRTGLSKWTRELEQMYGFAPGQFSGMQADWEKRLHPDDRDELRRGFEAAGNGPFEKEFRVVWPDGSVRWMLCRAASLKDKTGTAERLIGINIDVTERKETEARLRDSQRELAMQVADLELLQKISTELIQEESVKNLYETIADAAVVIMHSDFASMQMLYTERGQSGELLLLAYRGFTPEASQFWEWVPADSGSTCAAALRTRQRVIVSDIEKCDFMVGTEDLRIYRQTGIRAVQSTPLLSRTGQIVGMISTHWREEHTPSERDLRTFDVLARQAADLIERRRTAEAALEKEQQLSALAARLDRRVIDANISQIQKTNLPKAEG
ncbi:MAG TPA: response regulator [Candidatus Sulfotelmatobacter sp.]|nr:response regulator [Candidatus Sulfotelmatobacter sp.]